MSSAIYRWAAGALIAIALTSIALLSETTAAPKGPATRGLSSQLSREASGNHDDYFDTEGRRLREGTVINDASGYFRQDGDGATFVTDEGLELGGLPNLNLERIARTLKGTDESKSIRWSVSGTVTEFSGRNYILISRAVYKSTTPPPIPEQLLN